MGRQDQEGLRLRFQVQPRHLRRLLAVCLDWFHKLAYKLQGRQPCSRGMQQLGGQASERPRCACCAAAGDHSVHSAPRRYRPRRRWRSAQLPAEKQETEREGKSVLGGGQRERGGGESVMWTFAQALQRCAARRRELRRCYAAPALQPSCAGLPQHPPPAPPYLHVPAASLQQGQQLANQGVQVRGNGVLVRGLCGSGGAGGGRTSAQGGSQQRGVAWTVVNQAAQAGS